jgi:hypothetical protein
LADQQRLGLDADQHRDRNLQGLEFADELV